MGNHKQITNEKTIINYNIHIIKNNLSKEQIANISNHPLVQ